MLEELRFGLELMGKGMLGIFVVIGIIMLSVMIMNYILKNKDEKNQ